MEAFMELMEKFVVMPLLALLCIACGLLMFVGIPYGLYAWATYKPPETFSLRVDSWECSSEHEQRYETCGAKTGCHWNTRIICDQWTAK